MQWCAAVLLILLHSWKVWSRVIFQPPSQMFDGPSSLLELDRILSISLCIMHSRHKLVHCDYKSYQLDCSLQTKCMVFIYVKVLLPALRRPHWRVTQSVFCLFGGLYHWENINAHAKGNDVEHSRTCKPPVSALLARAIINHSAGPNVSFRYY